MPHIAAGGGRVGMQRQLAAERYTTQYILIVHYSDILSGDKTVPLPSRQSSWDRPGVLRDRALVESSLSSASQRATFLAASAAHSGDWLFAMPISSCGLRMDGR